MPKPTINLSKLGITHRYPVTMTNYQRLKNLNVEQIMSLFDVAYVTIIQPFTYWSWYILGEVRYTNIVSLWRKTLGHQQPWHWPQCEIRRILGIRIPKVWKTTSKLAISLRWRHNGCDSVSNHQPRECLLRRLIRRTSKKTSKLRVTGLCAGNSPETGEFPAQMASNAENVSIWWRHHVSALNIFLTRSIHHGDTNVFSC